MLLRLRVRKSCLRAAVSWRNWLCEGTLRTAFDLSRELPEHVDFTLCCAAFDLSTLCQHETRVSERWRSPFDPSSSSTMLYPLCKACIGHMTREHRIARNAR